MHLYIRVSDNEMDWCVYGCEKERATVSVEEYQHEDNRQKQL